MNTKNEVKLQQEYIEKVKKINQNKNLKYNILTFGCQLNENDSEKLCGMLEEMGYTKTEKPEEADGQRITLSCKPRRRGKIPASGALPLLGDHNLGCGISWEFCLFPGNIQRKRLTWKAFSAIL